MAFIVISQPTTSETDRLSALTRVNQVRKAWQWYSAKAIDYLNADGVIRLPKLENGDPNPAYIPKFDTHLNPKIF